MMYTEDDYIGEILLDLFEKENFPAKVRACLLVHDVVPYEEQIAEDRRKFRALLSSDLPEEHLVPRILEFRRNRYLSMGGSSLKTIPAKLFGLIIDLWLPDVDDRHLRECTEWIDQFLKDEKVDTTETHRKMLEEFAG